MAVPATVNVSMFDGSNGFKLVGAASNIYSVASVGDFDGDGFGDFVVGTKSSGAYVVYGRGTGFTNTVDLANLDGITGFKVNPEARHLVGRAVAVAGDVNGDGFDDLFIGGESIATGEPGVSYVVFGKATGVGAAFDLSAVDGSNGFRLNGVDAGDLAGASVASAGDVNGDGYDDLIVGAPNYNAGESYVVFGKATGFAATVDLSSLDGNAGFKLIGAAPFSGWSGFSVASAGDINGDGFADVIVGAPNENSVSGAAYVVFGKAAGFASAFNLAALNGSNGFRMSGPVGSGTGWSVASAGDVNGDGFADAIVGAQYARTNGVYSGASYVVFGKAGGFDADVDLAGLDGSDGFMINGASDYDFSGRSVASAGDLNGDGFDDLIIGAAGHGKWAAYVVFGKTSDFGATIELSNLDGLMGFELVGDNFGTTVSSAGDVNGDGYDDLIVGRAAYVMFGGAFGDSTAPVTTTGTSAAEMLIGGRGNDLLSGGGGSDVFHGGAGKDRLTVADLAFSLADGGNGVDTLALGGAGLTLDLSDTLVAAKVKDIERIDLSGTGNNTLVVSQLSVIGGAGFTVDGKHVLVVEADAGDAVRFVESAWAKTDSFANADGTFDRWVLGAAEVHVEQTASPPEIGATIVGTAGNDIISTIQTLPGQLLATGFGDVIDGAAGDDLLDGGGGNDALYGGAGDDTLIGGAATAGGVNQLWGGTESDTASYAGTIGMVYADLAAQAGYVGGVLVDQMNSVENLTGGSGADVLVGDAGGNMLAGDDGSDLLYGQDGNDTLLGGTATLGGTNQLWGGAGIDAASYDGTTGAVYADIGSLAAYVDGVLTDQMNSIENLVGSAGNDVLVGDGGTNVLMGGAGADVLYGQGGDDVLTGGAVAPGSTNQLWGGTGTDAASYAGTTGAVYADLGALSAYVDSVLTDQMNSIENLVGGSGSDVLVGDTNGNVLTGGANTDYLYGQDGNDTLIGGAAAPGDANQLWGGTGSDTASYAGMTGSVYADLGAQAGYVGGVLVDLMNSIENLTGGSNADTLLGDVGGNRLLGGGGGDALWGRGGADVFVYQDYADSNLVTGYDVIGDFVSGTSKLDLTALGIDASQIVIQSSAGSTSLYVEMSPGAFDASTDLAISFTSANAINLGDIMF